MDIEVETNPKVAILGWRLQLAIRSVYDGIGGSWVEIVVDIEYRMVDIAWKLPKFTTISTFFDCCVATYLQAMRFVLLPFILSQDTVLACIRLA